MGILAFLVLLLAIPLTVNIAQKQQELRQRAAFEDVGGGTCTTNIVKKCYNPEVPAPDCTLSPDDTSNCSYAFLATTGRWFNCLEQVCPASPGTTEACYVIGLAPSNCHQGGSKVCGIPEVPFICESNPSTVTLQPPCPKFVPDNALGNPNDYVQNGTRYVCSPPPTPSCDSLNGQCLPLNVGFGDSLTKYNGSCDNPDYGCFEKYKSSGNVSNTGNIINSCTKDAPGGHYEYVCGSNAGCPAGQHKAAYICPNVGTWSDVTCYPGTDFTVNGVNYVNCVTQTGGAPGAGVGGAPTACNIDSPGTFRYDCSASNCTSGHFAIKVCSPGVEKKDDTCYPGKDFTVGGKNYVNCVAQTGTAAPALAKCPETGRTACQASPNTCAAQGTQTITYSGQACTPDSQNVSCPNPASNCNPGSQCPTAGSGTCVAKVQTPAANAQTLTFAIGLDGFGTAGDKKAPGKATGITPKRTRSFFYQVFDKEGAGATELDSGQNQLNFDSGKFTASFKLNKSLTPGAYVIKVRPVGYLSRVIRNVLVDTTTATSPIAVETLATGDIDGDNHLTVNDYTKLKDCMFKDATGACQGADLDDSGKVDQFDYNLFLREIASVQDGE